MEFRAFRESEEWKFTRPQKQPMHEPVIDKDDDMAEAEDDPLSKLMTRLPRLKKGALEIYWDLRVSLAADGHHSQTRVMGKSRGQLVQVLYPKVCNKQLDSWECGFYVMSWIKTIIWAAITDNWNERFKSTSHIPEDTSRQIRQEWTTYFLQRWS
ncbi:hypothetical protein LR48_Vigan08g098800 [Vigna angularis]|uniref:Ubiquitin-like protease family profile domain-containing protein n=1 Tax=Phaseolus angularis TaxID=3914 RepID=A0A0L9V566_PHAAN|nr:hypothetical protein LR48_Vigan08g098800 [Vigna angularis]